MYHLRNTSDSSVGKESVCNAGDPGLIPGSGRSPGEGIGYPLQYSLASFMAQLVKNPPAMWETWVQSLGWRRARLPIPVFWPREFHGLYSPWGRKESDMTERLAERLKLHFLSQDCSLSCLVVRKPHGQVLRTATKKGAVF